MLVIDAHQHCWDPQRVRYDWLGPELAPIDMPMEFDQLRPHLDAAGVDYTVMVQSADNDADTDYMFDLAAAEARIAAVVGWVDLTRPAGVADRLDELAARPGLVGVRALIHNYSDADWLLRPEVRQSLTDVAARGLTFDVVAVFPRHLALVPELSRRHPDLRMVIDHLAKPPAADDHRFGVWRGLLAAAADNPLVHAKVSGLYAADGDLPRWSVDSIRPAVETALEVFGPDRLMYGGDWPICELAGGYRRVWSGVRELLAGLGPGEQEAVFATTATRFYRISADRLRSTAATP